MLEALGHFGLMRCDELVEKRELLRLQTGLAENLERDRNSSAADSPAALEVAHVALIWRRGVHCYDLLIVATQRAEIATKRNPIKVGTMQIPAATVEKLYAFRREPGQGIEGALVETEMLLNIERQIFPFHEPFARRRKEDTAVEIRMLRRDAELLKKAGERGRILSFRVPATAKHAKIVSVGILAGCDDLAAAPHLANQRRDFRTWITGQHHIAVEPDHGVDVAGDEIHQCRFAIPGMQMALGYRRISVEKLVVGFQEVSLAWREAEVAHLDCAGRSSIRKRLQENQRLQEHPVIRAGNKLNDH